MNAPLSPQAAKVFLHKQGPDGHQPASDTSARGCVEGLDAALGLMGWFADPKSAKPATLVLWAGDEELATTETKLYRDDIWIHGSAEVPAGFRFDIEELVKVSARQDINPEAILRVRPRDSSAWLHSEAPLTFADIGNLRPPALATPYVEGRDGPLASELRRLASKAFRQLSQPQRAVSQGHSGVVEYVVRLTRHTLLVGGWMNVRMPAYCALLISAPGLRRAGSMCVVTADRSDLPPSAQAFAGLLYVADGIDAADISEQTRIYLAGTQMDWLLPVPDLRRPELAVVMGEADALFERSGATTVQAIRHIIRDSLPWPPQPQRSASLGVKVGIDRCFVAPGFGLFVSGWILHPMSRPVRIRAKLGAAQFVLDPRSLTASPRSDLAEIFPKMADRVALAGFSGLLRGDDDPDCLDPWVVRFDFADGTVHMHELSPEIARRIDAEFDFKQLSSLVPGLEWAPWLQELAAAVAFKAERDVAKDLQWLSEGSCATALVCALPEPVTHQRIALDYLRRALGRLSAPDVGLVMLLPSSLSLGLWASWEELLRRDGVTMAIVSARLPSAADVWNALLPVLEHCKTRRFAFVGPGVLLLPEGMQAIDNRLRQPNPDLLMLNVLALKGQVEVLTHDANAFCWTYRAFLEHRSSGSALLPGIWRTQGLPASPTPVDSSALPQGLRLAAGRPDTLRDSINTRLLAIRDLSAPASEQPESAAGSTTP